MISEKEIRSPEELLRVINGARGVLIKPCGEKVYLSAWDLMRMREDAEGPTTGG